MRQSLGERFIDNSEIFSDSQQSLSSGSCREFAGCDYALQQQGLSKILVQDDLISGRFTFGGTPAYGSEVRACGPFLFGGLKPTASTKFLISLLTGR